MVGGISKAWEKATTFRQIKYRHLSAKKIEEKKCTKKNEKEKKTCRKVDFSMKYVGFFKAKTGILLYLQLRLC